MSSHPKSSSSQSIEAAGQVFAALFDLSELLNTGLDKESLSLCVRLCEAGANPEALATVIRELKKQAAAYNNDQENSNQEDGNQSYV